MTNREIHEIIRQHVSRFVPSLKNTSLKTTEAAFAAPSKATAAAGGRTLAEGRSAAGASSSSLSSPLVATESSEGDLMLVDEPESQEQEFMLQEAGISSTRCVYILGILCCESLYLFSCFQTFLCLFWFSYFSLFFFFFLPVFRVFVI